MTRRTFIAVTAGCLVALALLVGCLDAWNLHKRVSALEQRESVTIAEQVYWDTYMTCQEQIGKGCEERAEAAKKEYLAQFADSK